jgi:hypothetical protein
MGVVLGQAGCQSLSLLALELTLLLDPLQIVSNSLYLFATFKKACWNRMDC